MEVPNNYQLPQIIVKIKQNSMAMPGKVFSFRKSRVNLIVLFLIVTIIYNQIQFIDHAIS